MSLKESQSVHWKRKDLNTIESYWSSPKAVERSKFLVKYLKKYEFGSIFEVGYLAGRNLRYIQEEFPTKHIDGLEINPKATQFARDKLSMPHLRCMNLHNMHTLERKFDIVFTSGVMIHVPTEDIKGVVEKCIDLSNKYVMHLEECGNGELIKGPKHMKPKKRPSDQWQWAPNLVDTYKELGYTPKVIELPPDCKTNGATELLIVEL